MNNQETTAKSTINKAAPFGWGLYTDGDEAAAFYTQEEAVEFAKDDLKEGRTVRVKPLKTPLDWLNFTATFEGDSSSYANDQIIQIAEEIKARREKAKEAGEGRQYAINGEATGVGAYGWDD